MERQLIVFSFKLFEHSTAESGLREAYRITSLIVKTNKV